MAAERVMETSGGGVLDQEISFYESQRDELLEHHSGKFVLIKGDKLVGAFDTQEAAYTAGVERFGNQPMFIRQVTSDDPVEFLPALMHGVLVAYP